MSRKTYRFSIDQINFTHVERNFKWWFKRIGIFTLCCMLLGTMGFFLTSRVIETPSEKNLKAQNEKLLNLFESLDHRLDEYDHILASIRAMDDSIYRSLVGTDPLPGSLRDAGIGGFDREEVLRNAGYPESIINTATQITDLQSRLKIQQNSYQEVFREALRNQNKLQHLPAIMPIHNENLRHTGAGFGMRFHPILKIWRMHEGMDFFGSKGTEIYASANGRVKDVRFSKTFGNVIEIDHGYEILTLYAHLSKTLVRKGQEIARGQLIGEMGSTGLSSGNHLHYEVHIKGTEVDPVNYFFQDLSPKEYEMVLAIGQAFKTSMD
jgi:murein DD-endopeptidase MepM/ murein hydrolase activator NlpD